MLNFVRIVDCAAAIKRALKGFEEQTAHLASPFS